MLTTEGYLIPWGVSLLQNFCIASIPLIYVINLTADVNSINAIYYTYCVMVPTQIDKSGVMGK